jgi:protein phosphatase
MIATQRIIYCTNIDCPDPINSVGDEVCASCQTSLVYRYLWATGTQGAKIPVGKTVAGRYEVVRPQIWLDTQPGTPPDVPEEVPQSVIPYLRLYSQQLHLPQVYGFTENDILLLENLPIDETGNLYPTITQLWQQTTAVRQVYWLWQILQLWTPLLEQGVAASLLVPHNLRVQGWCVRLLELYVLQPPTLQQLAECWQPLAATAHPNIASYLQKIVQQMRRTDVELEKIILQLNQLLLASVGELPLSLKVVGSTDIGGELTQNEDTCFPNSEDAIDDPLLPQVSIVCDGIGGHEGGEVASRLGLQSLKLQIRALLSEVTIQTELTPPNLLQQQLEASLRVVNNLICNCNNEQNREGLQRMGTTVAMAIQLPQRVQTLSGLRSDGLRSGGLRSGGLWSENSHELYLMSVGDSRAYWITEKYCQLLTVDDDVTAREVRNTRQLYRKALQRPDATALTQALGTKDAEFLRPTIQRFILEEEGILLLCSDGLSDNNLVEQSWRQYALPVLTNNLSLKDAVDSWIELANRKNGHDNISLVMTLCRLVKETVAPVGQLSLPVETQKEEIEPELQIELKEPQVEGTVERKAELEPELSESSQALLDLYNTAFVNQKPVNEEKASSRTKNRGKGCLMVAGLLILLFGGTGVGLFALWRLRPQTFQEMCRRLPSRVERICPR